MTSPESLRAFPPRAAAPSLQGGPWLASLACAVPAAKFTGTREALDH